VSGLIVVDLRESIWIKDVDILNLRLLFLDFSQVLAVLKCEIAGVNHDMRLVYIRGFAV